MRLDEFERQAVGDLLRLTAPLADENGEQAYQLLVQGLSWDSVGFSRPPWFPFFPLFRVFGFAPSFAQFTGTSFGIP